MDTIKLQFEGDKRAFNKVYKTMEEKKPKNYSDINNVKHPVLYYGVEELYPNHYEFALRVDGEISVEHRDGFVEYVQSELNNAMRKGKSRLFNLRLVEEGEEVEEHVIAPPDEVNTNAIEAAIAQITPPKAPKIQVKAKPAPKTNGSGVSNAQKVREYILEHYTGYAEADHDRKAIIDWACALFNTRGAASCCVRTNTKRVFNVA